MNVARICCRNQLTSRVLGTLRESSIQLQTRRPDGFRYSGHLLRRRNRTENMANPERTVVVAMDGSDYSNYAFDWYMKNAYHKGDHVIFVHCPEYHTVVQSPMVMADVTVLTDMWKEEEKRIKELLEKLGQQMKDHGIGGKVKSIGGSPGEVICQVAKDESAQLIVTGTRGMGKIRRTFLGSVSDYILHHAHVPVLVCRHKDDHHKN